MRAAERTTHLADVLELLGAHIVSVHNERLVKGVQVLAQLVVVCGSRI